MSELFELSCGLLRVPAAFVFEMRWLLFLSVLFLVTSALAQKATIVREHVP